MSRVHLVETDIANSKLSIFRVLEDGTKVLFTSIEFDAIRAMGFSKFSAVLGENIALDNDTLRKIFENGDGNS
jgi:hypothetical protein